MSAKTSKVPTWPELTIPTLRVRAKGCVWHRRRMFDAVADALQIGGNA